MRKNLLSMVCMLALCTGFAMAAGHAPVPVMFYDHTGSLITDTYVLVTDQAGRTVAKLAPASDGVYNLDSGLMGQKVVFRVDDPSLGSLNTMDARIPEWIQGPVVITLPTPPASPQGVPGNDTCDTAIAIAVPSLTAGDTIGATVDNTVPDCETPNTAGGVWYSVVGTGNPITLTTCELDTGTPGSADYDTKISVYCLGCETPACVAGNDDTAGGDFCGFTFHSTLTFSSELGVEYLVLVHGFSTGTGSFNLSAYEGGTPTSPAVSCVPPEPTGACCVQECLDPVFGSCTSETASDCAADGGEYQGDGTQCVQPNGTTLSLTNNTQIAIPDGTSTFVCTSIDVDNPANCDSVSDVDVRVIITHTWIGDLFIDLNGPNGETTNVWQNRCGSTDNMDFWFDDEGTDTSCVVVSTPGGAGRGQPAVAGLGPALAQFDGLSPEGTWELCVMDTFPADVGTLNSWTLEVDCGSELCVFLPTPEPSCDPTPTPTGTPTPTPTPTPDPGHGHGHGGKGGHGWWWGWDDTGDGSDLGLEAFGDSSNGEAINPVISARPRNNNSATGNDRGPRTPVGSRLPR